MDNNNLPIPTVHLTGKVINSKYFFVVGLAVLVTMSFHELGHFAMARMLGLNVSYTLNQVDFLDNYSISDKNLFLITASGPFFSILLMFVSFIIFVAYKEIKVLPFILAPFVLRVWPYLVSPVKWQDEAKLAELISCNKWILIVSLWAIMFVVNWISFSKIKIPYYYPWITIILIICFFLIFLGLNNIIFE